MDFLLLSILQVCFLLLSLPVSYTHLDVYKRQVKDSPKIKCKSFLRQMKAEIIQRNEENLRRMDEGFKRVEETMDRCLKNMNKTLETSSEGRKEIEIREDQNGEPSENQNRKKIINQLSVKLYSDMIAN